MSSYQTGRQTAKYYESNTAANNNPAKAPTGPNPQNRLVSDAVQGAFSAAAAVAKPPVQAPSAPAAPVPQAAPNFDYNTDPMLQIVMGQQQLAIAQAQADAIAQQKLALIAYGDPHLALAVLGDQTTADAAANNPGSTLAQLMAQNKTNVRNVNESENKANLFYSSDAGYQLGLAQKAYLAQQAQASGNVNSQLGTIGSNLLAAQQSAYNAEIQAQQDAYNRALQNPQLGASGGNNEVPSGSQNDWTNPDISPNATATSLQAGVSAPNANGVYPATTALPQPVKVTANKTGGSANKTQGVFAVH